MFFSKTLSLINMHKNALFLRKKSKNRRNRDAGGSAPRLSHWSQIL